MNSQPQPTVTDFVPNLEDRTGTTTSEEKVYNKLKISLLGVVLALTIGFAVGVAIRLAYQKYKKRKEREEKEAIMRLVRQGLAAKFQIKQPKLEVKIPVPGELRKDDLSEIVEDVAEYDSSPGLRT